MTGTDPYQRAADAARTAYGKLLSILASRTGDIAGAEDALADAFLSALRTWPERGVPDRPEAWLLTVARNRQTDQARASQKLVITDDVPDMIDTPDILADPVPDDRLKLLFVCAHPAVDPNIHTPLMLQTVLGLEAVDIARAFLVPAGAMAQRLVRAKRKIKASGIPFAVPDRDLFPNRIAAVREAVYGAFSVDWLSTAGDLSHEAFFLSCVLADLAGDDPETLGLCALIGFVEARRAARVLDGILVPVPEQDVTRWNQTLIDRAAHMLTRASRHDRPGRFQLEAAIQSVHAARAVTGRTDWRALSQLYTGLCRFHATIGAAVGRAAVVAEDAGPAEGLALLDRITYPDIERYQPAVAVRAHCLAALGHKAEAADAYAKAMSLSTHAPSRKWLEAKFKQLQRH